MFTEAREARIGAVGAVAHVEERLGVVGIAEERGRNLRRDLGDTSGIGPRHERLGRRGARARSCSPRADDGHVGACNR